MSCARVRDWPVLLGHRFERDDEAPAGFAEALAHAGGCPDCRSVALRIDPTLLFGPLAESAPGAAHQREADGEVESMRAAVDQLRRLRRLDAGDPGARRAAWRWPAAAGFLLAVLSLAPATVVQRVAAPPPGAVAQRPAGFATAVSAFPAQWSMAPVVEPLGGEARIYELDSASDLAVVLIVDQTIDV
jgi:hypothetical protein